MGRREYLIRREVSGTLRRSKLDWGRFMQLVKISVKYIILDLLGTSTQWHCLKRKDQDTSK